MFVPLTPQIDHNQPTPDDLREIRESQSIAGVVAIHKDSLGDTLVKWSHKTGNPTIIRVAKEEREIWSSCAPLAALAEGDTSTQAAILARASLELCEHLGLLPKAGAVHEALSHIHNMLDFQIDNPF